MAAENSRVHELGHLNEKLTESDLKFKDIRIVTHFTRSYL
jgi:hypothetical protein